MSKPIVHVLAVEDEAINQMILKVLFNNLHLVGEVVSTGEQAVNLLQNDHDLFDLIFMDLSLPDMTGILVTQQIRAYERSKGIKPLHICALTADDSKQKRQECLSAGMNDFLTKPITSQKIEDILEGLELKNSSVA